MFQHHTPYFLIFISSLLVFLSACDESTRRSSPILPGEIAILTVKFSPESVSQGYSNRYEFTVTVREVNGVGARLASIKVEDFDEDGIQLKKDDYAEWGIINTFGTSYIEPFGTLNSRITLECRNCARENWLVRADDNKGNHVEGSGWVELIQR